MRLPLIDPNTAPGPAAELLAEVQRRLGVTPDMTRAMANSPALLKGYLGLSGALARGVLDGATRKRIALAVAQSNVCDYCQSAHSYLAEHAAHLDAGDVTAARRAQAGDSRTAAILALATVVNDTRGDTPADALEAARTAGVTDGEIAGSIGHVALNVLSNYFNKTAWVEIDFPVITA